MVKNYRNHQRNKIKNTQKQKTKMSKFLIFSSIIIIILFIILVFILNSFRNPEKPKNEKKPSILINQGNNFPEKPETRWNYIKELENRIVIEDPVEENKTNENHLNLPQKRQDWTDLILNDLSENKQKKKKIDKFIYQCAAFKTENVANEIQVKLILSGIQSFIKQENQWFKVFIGPFNDEFSITNYRQILEELNLSSCVLVN